MRAFRFNSKNIIFTLIFVVILNVFFCGYSIFDSTTVTIDTDKKHVYELFSADTILNSFFSDKKNTKAKYDGKYSVLSGKVSNIKKKNKGFEIIGITSGEEKTIECTSSNPEIISQIGELSEGDDIFIYGRLSIDMFDKDVKIKEIEKIEKLNNSMFSYTHFLLDGSKIDYNGLKSESLNGGTVKYKVPKEWESVKHDIKNEEIGCMEGYQYALNQLSDDSIPESFFVCYFKNDDLLSDPDNDRNETDLIEKKIVKNISGKEIISFKDKTAKTYYGAKYKYFKGQYNDIINAGEGYRTEYIFQQNDDDGFVVYLYVYQKEKHLDDIMFVTRFLEMN